MVQSTRDRWLQVGLTAGLFCVSAILGFIFHAIQPAAAAWENVAQEWAPYNLTPEQKSWFRNLRSPHGVPCCNMADGHRTSYDMRADNHYWVPIEGEWRQVPSEAVVYNAGNPVGEAVVWYVLQGQGAVFIRCFVPGGGV